MSVAKGGIDWSRCIFCQKNSRSDKTCCPGNSKRADVGCGYKSLSDAVAGYLHVGQLPADIDVQLWDEGDGIEATLTRHAACWHRSCRNRLLHPTTLSRKRKHDVANNECAELADDTGVNNSQPAQPCVNTPRATRALTGFTTETETVSCFFCNQPGKDLRQVMTFSVDEHVRKCASITNDSLLLGKLACGDMIAQEARYHPVCLLSLYRSAAQKQSAMLDTCSEYSELPSNLTADSLALAELVAYIEQVKNSQSTPSVFTLNDLARLYTAQLHKHNVGLHTKVNSTRLKDRLLENCTGLTAVNHGREVLLTFSEHVGEALQQMRDTADAEAIHMIHAAETVRNHVLSSAFHFDGSLSGVDNIVPPALLSFVSMLLEGPGNLEGHNNQAALSISQLIMYNTKKRPRRKSVSDASSISVRHSVDREMPLPMYIGLKLHSVTRKQKIIDKLFRLGLSISYDRVMQISNKTANSICELYKAKNLVCPPVLQPKLFTVAAADNIDHNLSSNTAHSSFHGTAISLIQFPALQSHGDAELQKLSHFLSTASDLASDIALPSAYAEVPPCSLPPAAPVIPKLEFCLRELDYVEHLEYDWLNCVYESVCDNDDQVYLAWAAYRAGKAAIKDNPLPIMALLPLFRDSANSAAMIRHSLTVVQTAIHELNPGQIPVVTVDQPLYALAKQIQWQFPNKYGEDKFVILLGGLHIEMAALRMVGHWLDGSGWIESLSQAGVVTPGVAESFISVSHVKRTRYAHTVTSAALYICLKRSYSEFCEQQNGVAVMTFDEWYEERKKSSVQFRFWDTALELELMVLTFVRSLREGNFQLYVDCLQKLLPWFFACDHTNYARWLSVHVRDMLSLQQTHPAVYTQFMCGNFSVAKTRNKFSSIAIDQVHEQLNAQIKGEGGAIGITENDAALRRWTIAGPEIMRMLQDFETGLCFDASTDEHHEQSPSFQRRFREDVNKLLEVFADEIVFNGGNNYDDLVALCSHSVAHLSVAATVRSAENIGKMQMQTFIDERLKGSVSIMSPLSKNKLPLFSFKPATRTQKGNILKLREFKTDCELFSHLFIACQSRDGDLDEFFRHENHPYPPSLSVGGSLRLGSKSDLLECLTSQCDSCLNDDIASFTTDSYVLDGAAIVQMLRPVCCKTFEEYKNKIFVPHIMSLLKKCNRVDVVFDVYWSSSLKLITREHRGRGVRMKVTGSTKLPSNWQEFLRVDENKTELFHYLAESRIVEGHIQNKTVIITSDEHAKLCAGCCDDLATVDPCNHEEADTRILLHCLHMSQLGSKSVTIRTVDSDVVVLAISFFKDLNLEQLWIHFGVGKNVKLIAIHELTNHINPLKCEALPMFHAFTGCDTVSCFHGKGKKSAWNTWNSYPEVTAALVDMKNVQFDVNENDLHILQRYVILMYDRTSDCNDLDSARKHLFTKKSKMLEMLPPTSNAFVQHVKRAVHQAIHCWSQCLTGQMILHDPNQCGWSSDDDRWVPLWMTIPEVAKSCTELIHCSCKKGCTARCKCVKANLPCTALCQCDGECDRT